MTSRWMSVMTSSRRAACSRSGNAAMAWASDTKCPGADSGAGMISAMYSGTLRPCTGRSTSGRNTLMPIPTHTPPPHASSEMPQSLRYSSALLAVGGHINHVVGPFHLDAVLELRRRHLA